MTQGSPQAWCPCCLISGGCLGLCVGGACKLREEGGVLCDTWQLGLWVAYCRLVFPRQTHQKPEP